jgi:hypothetical protein
MRHDQVSQVPESEVIELLSDSEDDVAGPKPEVIDLVSDLEEDPEEPEPEVIDLVSDSEDDDDMPPVAPVVGNIPTVANQVRVGEWHRGV